MRNQYRAGIVLLASVLTLSVGGCQGVETATLAETVAASEAPTATVEAATDTPLPSPSPTVATVTPTVLPTPNVSLEGVSFWESGMLPGVWRGQTIPQSRPDGLPSHVWLNNDDFNGLPMPPQLYVFETEYFEAEVGRLREILQGDPVAPAGEIPVLPESEILSAECPQALVAKVQSFRFQHGEGVRFLVNHQCAPTIVTNWTIFYTFQGLTDDGELYVSLIYPIRHPSLPERFEDGQIIPGFNPSTNGFEGDHAAYLEGVLETLNAADLDSFEPDLSKLDALARSLVVEPRLPLGPAATETPVLPTPTAELGITPAEPVAAPNVDADGVTFELEEAVSTGWEAEYVAENDRREDSEGIPAYLQIALPGYAVGERAEDARLFIMPTYDLDALKYEGYLQRVEALRQFLQTRPAVVPPAHSPQDGIPRLPFRFPFGIVQFFTSRIAYLDFQNGSGVRYLVAHANELTPLTNTNLYYAYQGLTSDGRYVVSAYLPVQHPGLPHDVSEVPELDDYQTFAERYPDYMEAWLQLIGGAGAGEFTPDVSSLDRLIQSMRIEPEAGL